MQGCGVLCLEWNKNVLGRCVNSYLGRGGDGKRVMLGVSYNLPNMKF